MYDSRMARWMSTDPYEQYWSPYLAMGNDPVNGIDPDGGRKVNYDANGNWIGTTNDTWLHNLFFGTQRYWNGEKVSQREFHSRQGDLAASSFLSGGVMIPTINVTTADNARVHGVSQLWNSEWVRNKTGDAISIGLPIHAYAPAGGSTTPLGVIMTLRGPDAFKPRVFTDIGVGAGFDISGSIEYTKYRLHGKVEGVLLNNFTGWRAEVNLSAQALGRAGLSAGVSPTDAGLISYGGVSLGVSVPIPLPVNGNFNAGYTKVFTKNK